MSLSPSDKATMRILLVTDWNRGRGGAESYIAGLHTGLEWEGDQVKLLTSSAGTAGDGHADYIAYGTECLAAQALLQIANPFAMATVRRAVRDFCPDVAFVNMFAHHLSPAALFPLGDLPSVLYVSDYKCICPVGSKLLPDGSLCTNQPGLVCWQSGCTSLPHWLRDLPRYALIRSQLSRFTKIITCSEWVRKALSHHGIAAETLLMPSPPPQKNYLRSPSPWPQLLYVGRLDREKGIDLLLRAMERLNGVRLRIVGEGPLRPRLEHLAKSLGIGDRVSFIGWLEPSAINIELARTWALVVPSLWAEPLGLVAVEAVTRGVPVVASQSGGLAEIIEPGVTGLLFPNGDAAALEKRLRQLVSGTAFPGFRLPEDAVERAANRFNEASHIKALRSIMKEVAGSRIHTQSRA